MYPDSASPRFRRGAATAPDPFANTALFRDVAPKRLIAWLVDTLIIALITAAIVPFTAFTALFFLSGLFLMVNLTYRILTLAGGSATPGMRLMAIELRSRRGTWLDLQTAVLHTLGYTLSMAFVVPQVISVALMVLGGRGQGLTDLVLGTSMVNRAYRH